MMIKVPMTAVGFDRLQEELKRLKTIDRPAIIRADRRGARTRRHLGKRRIPRRARTPELHRGPRPRTRGQDRPRRGDRRLQAFGQAGQVRRHRDPRRRGDRGGRRSIRSSARTRPISARAGCRSPRRLAARPDRQGHRRKRRGYDARAARASYEIVKVQFQ